MDNNIFYEFMGNSSVKLPAHGGDTDKHTGSVGRGSEQFEQAQIDGVDGRTEKSSGRMI